MVAPMTSAAVPGTLGVMASLGSSGGGVATDGVYDLTFAIYNVKSGGSTAWVEGPLKVSVKGGRFVLCWASSSRNAKGSNARIYFSHEYAGNQWADNMGQVVHAFDTNERYWLRIHDHGGGNNYAYHHGSSNGTYGNLTVTYPGPMLARRGSHRRCHPSFRTHPCPRASRGRHRRRTSPPCRWRR